jgi:hypothetical protein
MPGGGFILDIELNLSEPAEHPACQSLTIDLFYAVETVLHCCVDKRKYN